MPQFKFRLDNVLEFRKQVEDQYKRELASLKLLLLKEEKFLRDLEQKKAAMQETLKAQQCDTLNMDEILNYYNYLSVCRQKIVDQIAVINQCIELIETKRNELVNASKEKKIIEKLKDNQYQEFKQLLDRIETKMIDEIATSGYTHKR